MAIETSEVASPLRLTCLLLSFENVGYIDLFSIGLLFSRYCGYGEVTRRDEQRWFGCSYARIVWLGA